MQHTTLRVLPLHCAITHHTSVPILPSARALRFQPPATARCKFLSWTRERQVAGVIWPCVCAGSDIKSGGGEADTVYSFTSMRAILASPGELGPSVNEPSGVRSRKRRSRRMEVAYLSPGGCQKQKGKKREVAIHTKGQIIKKKKKISARRERELFESQRVRKGQLSQNI